MAPQGSVSGPDDVHRGMIARMQQALCVMLTTLATRSAFLRVHPDGTIAVDPPVLLTDLLVTSGTSRRGPPA